MNYCLHYYLLLGIPLAMHIKDKLGTHSFLARTDNDSSLRGHRKLTQTLVTFAISHAGFGQPTSPVSKTLGGTLAKQVQCPR